MEEINPLYVQVLRFVIENQKLSMRDIQKKFHLAYNAAENHREIFISLLRQVLIDNENVRITLNLHKLLNSEFPILATILEKRDAIALQRHWREQAMTFSELTVEIPD